MFPLPTLVLSTLAQLTLRPRPRARAPTAPHRTPPPPRRPTTCALCGREVGATFGAPDVQSPSWITSPTVGQDQGWDPTTGVPSDAKTLAWIQKYQRMDESSLTLS